MVAALVTTIVALIATIVIMTGTAGSQKTDNRRRSKEESRNKATKEENEEGSQSLEWVGPPKGRSSDEKAWDHLLYHEEWTVGEPASVTIATIVAKNEELSLIHI